MNISFFYFSICASHISNLNFNRTFYFYTVHVIIFSVLVSQHGFAGEMVDMKQNKSSVSNLPTIMITADEKSLTTSNTSLKMDFSVKEIPQSISVVTKEMMQEQGLMNTQDVLSKTIGITAKIYDTSRIIYSARGQRIQNFQVDGVAIPYDNNALDIADMAPYERIDVIHGAAGLTTGVGHPSAVVNFVRKRPSNEVKGNASLSYGTWNAKRAEFDFSGPILGNENIRGILGAAYENRNTFYDFQQNEKKVFYGLVEADLTDTSLLTFGADYQVIGNNAPTLNGIPYVYSDGSRSNFPRSKNIATRSAYLDKNSLNMFVNFQKSITGNWNLKASLNHQRQDMDALWVTSHGFPNRDISKGTGTTLSATQEEQEGVSTNFDVNLSGKFTVLGRDGDLVLGWSKNRYSLDKINHVNHTGANPSLYPTNIKTWNGYYDLLPTPRTGEVDNTLTMQDITYAALRISILDNLKMIGGGSVTNWNVENSDNIVKNYFTPYVGLIYDFDDNLTAYGSYTETFRPEPARGIDGQRLPPTYGKMSEVGLKGDFLDDSLTASIAVYKGTQEHIGKLIDRPAVAGPDQEAYDYFTSTWGGWPARATGLAKLHGLEVEFNGKLTPDWQVWGGYAYAKTVEIATHKPVDDSIPSQTFHIFTSYKLPGKLNQFTVGGGVDMYNEMFTDIGLSDGSERHISQGSYVLASLMLKYDINQNLTATLNANNLFDKNYYNHLGSTYLYGESRNVVLSLHAKF